MNIAMVKGNLGTIKEIVTSEPKAAEPAPAP